MLRVINVRTILNSTWSKMRMCENLNIYSDFVGDIFILLTVRFTYLDRFVV